MSKQNHSESEDPTWKVHMTTLMKRKKVIEIEKELDEAFYQYYTVERGQPVPEWKQKRDPDWWCKYLIFLGIEPGNP